MIQGILHSYITEEIQITETQISDEKLRQYKNEKLNFETLRKFGWVPGMWLPVVNTTRDGDHLVLLPNLPETLSIYSIGDLYITARRKRPSHPYFDIETTPAQTQ